MGSAMAEQQKDKAAQEDKGAESTTKEEKARMPEDLAYE